MDLLNPVKRAHSALPTPHVDRLAAKVLRDPDDLWAGQRASHPVSLMDVAPTAIAIAGEAVPDGLFERLLTTKAKARFSPDPAS